MTHVIKQAQHVLYNMTSHVLYNDMTYVIT